MKKELICITCPRGCHLVIDENLVVTGNTCPRGEMYAKAEVTHPVRMLTSTVRIKSKVETRLPVKTSGPIPKELISKAMEEIKKIEVSSPIKIGDIIIKNILGTNVNIISTKNVDR